MKALRSIKDESGQATILTLLCMTVLLGFIGFATDVGILLHAKRNTQTAADAAAIAGALEINYATMDGTTVAVAGQTAATQNGAGGATVVINNPPLYGPHKNTAGYVEAIVTQKQPTIFMATFASLFKSSSGLGSMNVSARAVATNTAVSQGCVYTLGSTGADISITGNSAVSVPNCGIVDDSSSSDAVDLTGNITLDARSIGVVGGVSKTGNVTVTPNPVTGIVPQSDPLGFLPTPVVPKGCTNSVNLTGNVTRTISPGCYSGISATGNINLTLNPGVYMINGPFGSFAGNVSVTGTGVTLILLGTADLTGNATLNLSAPTSGTYNGILIDQPSSNANSISITGNAGSNLHGVIYAPGSNVTLTGNSGSSIYTDFVTKSLTLKGNSGFNDYASLAGVTSPITAVKLVE